MNNIKYKAIRDYKPNTRFISLYHSEDTVSEEDEFRFHENGDIFVQGVSQERQIYDAKMDEWALRLEQ